MTLVSSLNLSGNPFEHYTAETEPDIARYAIRPPYLQSIADRARNLSSFILFGDRGAGKSATRITVYNEIWEAISEQPNGKHPFVVNLIDYSQLLPAFKKGTLSEKNLTAVTAFVVIEQVLAWLSSLEDSDRTVFIEGLNDSEKALIFALLKGFYFNVPEMDRKMSTSETFKLLSGPWKTRSAVWISQHWEAISKIFVAIVNALSKKAIDDAADISAEAEALLKSLIGDGPNTSRAVLNKLVELVQIFGFRGVCVLVDKVDETEDTTNSAEATARLIYPLLAHIQLLEIPGFSWTFFLWSNVRDHFDSKYPVRLDKIAHANITWNIPNLREMVETRIRFFSSGRLSFSDLLDPSLNPDDVFRELALLSVNSPRELIKLLDTIVREHDARGDSAPPLLDKTSLDIGQDKYAVETIGTWYAAKPLEQVLRLGKTAFVNKDVQAVFKIGDQGARVKINGWEDAGLVQRSGTVPSESGGKQVYRFVVTDERIKRIIERKLHEAVGADIEAPDDNELE